MTFRDRLKQMDACREAIDWVGDRDLETAWRDCERADWMLWLAGRAKVPGKIIVLCAVRFSETSAKYDAQGDNRAKDCRKTVRRWLRGQAMREELRSAARSARSAADSAAYSAYLAARSAALAADSAADAAYSAAYAAANAVRAAADGARAAAEAVADAAPSATYKKSQRQMADIVRKTIPIKYLKGDK